jgi:eukaryotic-like serine/threonine-protein kinase
VLGALASCGQLMFLADVCYVVRELARGLEYAYWSADVAGKRHAVVHRDVSMHTVMLGFDGAVKLLDFGLTLSAITEHEHGPIIGKWAYEAPETAVYDHVDHRSDLFSLGVLFYLLCSGLMPFVGAEPKDVVRKIRAGEYARLADIAPQVPQRISALVARLLDPNPDLRPTRAAEVVDELGEVMRIYGLDSSPQRIGDMVAAMFPVTGTPLVTDGTGVKIESPQEARTRRPRVSSIQIPMPRPHSPSKPPVQIIRQQLAQQDRRSYQNSLVNLAIAVAIVLVVILGVYFMASRY